MAASSSSAPVAAAAGTTSPYLRDPASYKWPDPHIPTKAWEILRVKQKVEGVPRLALTAPQPPNTLRLVCISDTHNITDNLVSLANRREKGSGAKSWVRCWWRRYAEDQERKEVNEEDKTGKSTRENI